MNEAEQKAADAILEELSSEPDGAMAKAWAEAYLLIVQAATSRGFIHTPESKE